MPSEVDQHGLPVPAKFEADPPSTRRARPASHKVFRWMVGLLLVAIVVAMFLESGWDKYGRQAIAQSIATRAIQAYEEGDVPAAIAKMSDAIEWAPDWIELYEMRAAWQVESNDPHAAINDYTQIIDLKPDDLGKAYRLRAQAYLRLKDYDHALADLDLAVEHRRPRDAVPFNERAYTRALANRDLDQALADVEQALEFDPDHPFYLDTRGYIRHLRGDDRAALEDLDLAIKKAEGQRVVDVRREQARGSSPQRIELVGKAWDQALAVMYHHRGEAQAKLGHAEAAESDLKHGDDLGYDPEAGVF